MSSIFDVPGTNPPNPFATVVEELLTSADPAAPCESTAKKAVAKLVDMVSSSPSPDTSLWELWDAFFILVARESSSHAAHLSLLRHLAAHPPTEPRGVPARSKKASRLQSDDGLLHWSTLPRFGWQWRDTHDIIEAWRDWDGVRRGGKDHAPVAGVPACDPARYLLNFVAFSAALVGTTGGQGVEPIFVFYACRDTLEGRGACRPEGARARPYKLAPERVWDLDLRVVATWVCGRGRALWEARGEYNQEEECKRALLCATDLRPEGYPDGEGLTRERWKLWEDRLRTLGGEAGLEGETRVVMREAADVIWGLLGA